MGPNNHLFEVNDKITGKRCEICSKLKIKSIERRSDVFIVNFDHISHLFLVFLLLARDKQMFARELFLV